jgi:hypothetical protein
MQARIDRAEQQGSKLAFSGLDGASSSVRERDNSASCASLREMIREEVVSAQQSKREQHLALKVLTCDTTHTGDCTCLLVIVESTEYIFFSQANQINGNRPFRGCPQKFCLERHHSCLPCITNARSAAGRARQISEHARERTSVTVRVPATSANMGPGFDCLGMALNIWSEVCISRADKFEIVYEGEGADSVPCHCSGERRRRCGRGGCSSCDGQCVQCSACKQLRSQALFYVVLPSLAP